MKLLFIGLTTRNYGTYRRMSQLGREMVKRGHDVTIMITSQNRIIGFRESFDHGIKIIEAPDLFYGQFRSGWDPWNTINRIWWLKNRHFDLVHAFECRPTVIYPALYCSRNGTPLVIDWADWFGKGGSVEERQNPVLRFILRPIETYFEEHFRPRAQANTVICSTLYEKALKLGIPKNRLLQIPIGCEPDVIKPGNKNISRNNFGLNSEGYYIGYLGAAFQGDAEFMADSLSHLQKFNPNTNFLWFGARPGNSIRKIEGIPRTHIIKNFPENQMSDLLACTDICWLPLRNTPANRGRWPSKLNEYLSAGRPIISTKVGDIEQVLRRWNVGILSQDNPFSFACKSSILLENKEERRLMEKEARRLAENELSSSSVSNELEGFYARIFNF